MDLLLARPGPFPRLSLGEDGIAVISDDKQQPCFALALWNGRDPILKRRLFAAEDYINLGATKTATVYRLLANPPKSHE